MKLMEMVAEKQSNTGKEIEEKINHTNITPISILEVEPEQEKEETLADTNNESGDNDNTSSEGKKTISIKL